MFMWLCKNRGEKAFCSEECRQRQIMNDERKDKCRSEASRSVELSSSPYGYANTPRGQIFSTGIVAIWCSILSVIIFSYYEDYILLVL